MLKKVLVCGATGFIGRNIAERYLESDDFEVIGTYHKSKPWTHPKLKMVQVDLTRADEVNQLLSGVDVLIQAAAVTSGAKDIVNRPYIHTTDNAVMNSLIFRAAFDQGVPHIVFFSCSVMYSPSEKPIKESDFDANAPMLPNYFGSGWTKIYLEKMAEFYSRLGKTKYTVIRHSNIYGPYDKFDLERSHVFGATVTKVMTSSDGKVRVWGTGEEERDLLYVSDLVDYVETAVRNQKQVFDLSNLGYGSAISVRDLVGKIIKLSGRNLEIEFDTSKPTIKTKLCLNTDRARLNLRWAPKISIDEGIQKTLEWYRKNYSL